MSGYEITLRDFQQLIEYQLKEWFGYEIAERNGEAMVFSNAGDAVDVERLHSEIQSDARQQYDLYQRAMTLWR